MFQKILCPIDLGEFTLPQLAFARSFAKNQNAEIHSLYVFPMSVEFYDMGSLIELQKVADDYAKKKALNLCGNDIVPIFTRGIADYQIVALAKKKGCDLILMPTHGYRGLKKFFFGSIFQGVIEHSEVPVLALPSHFLEKRDVQFVNPEKILCAIDLQKGSSKLIDLTENIASEFQASFSIIHCVDLHKELLENILPAQLAEVHEDVKTRILKENPTASGASEIIIDKGPAFEQIPKHVVDGNFDLLILGIFRKFPFGHRPTLYRTVSQLMAPALCVPT